MAKLAAYALVFALLSLLLFNSAYADVTLDDAKQKAGEAAHVAGEKAGEAAHVAGEKAGEAVEAGKSWTQWIGGVFGGENDDAKQAPAKAPADPTVDPTVAGGTHV